MLREEGAANIIRTGGVFSPNAVLTPQNREGKYRDSNEHKGNKRKN